MQKPLACLKKLVFAGQLTLISVKMFGVLSIFFECYKGRYLLSTKYLNTVLNKRSKTFFQAIIASITPTAMEGFLLLQ